ncbi:glycosyl transferase, group 1 family [Luminiphilus syltensis NOR5-1B]|uniref:Glycosyl transferase, group 1 family n=1 Tax=Luminiphilus syltensis NOR5-1B TaxID=565045 RepID=B8KYM8_9GAMM|nr:glycosyltransferase family 4 protein [Luminiphilus syltensis]EED34200.1 glycosyl transferase, group 1 family [Luminiphilus syltensis NOR5-1B]
MLIASQLCSAVALIKVLEWTNQWSMGGTEKTAQLFVEHLPKNKYAVFAAGWRGGERLAAFKRSATEIFINQNPVEMAAWIRSRGIDIVHFHRMGVTDEKLIKTFTNAGVKILVEHNIFGHFDPSADTHKIHRHILLSKAQRHIYAARAGAEYAPEKCVAMYMPIETRSWDQHSRPRDLSRPIFGRHSRAAAAKWHDINVDSLPHIREVLPDARFHIIGLPDEYRQKIKAIHCLDMVREFPPAIDNKTLSEFLYGINVFSHGSNLGESFGVAIGEAMSTGLPVVTHSGGDATQEELISDGFNGYVTHPNNAQGYAQRIIELLQNPEQMATQISRLTGACDAACR